MLRPFGVEDQTPGAAPFECDTIKIFSAEAKDCEKSAFKNFSFTYEIFENSVLVGNGDSSKFFWVVRPKVIYTVRFTAYDNCGNEATTEKEYQFWDCARPTVSCISEFNSAVTSDSLTIINAVDLNKGSFDNCTPPSLLRYKIWHESISTAPPSSKEAVLALPNALQLPCSYIGFQTVYFYVCDEEDNYDFCIVRVDIQNNQGIVCPTDSTATQSTIAGNIHTVGGKMVEDVNIQVEGQGDMPNPSLTGANGNYTFSVKKGQSYHVAATKNDSPLNGVTTFDLILISKHILGLELFDSPYKYIAADVNKSGTVTAYDLVQLRQLILNIITEFPNNDSWRFVDAKHNFTSNKPLLENFKEKIEINNHQSDKMDADFMAIKIGDLNGNAIANNLQITEARTTRSAMTFELSDRDLQAGETITIDFDKTNLQEINGYQFALQFAGLELLYIKEGLVKNHHFGHSLIERGILLLSWDQLAVHQSPITNHQSPVTNHQSPITNHFSLKFKALRAGKLSELLQLQPNILPTEAYKITGEILDVNLHFATNYSSLKLEQNHPNPFKESTKIGFQLPKAGITTLTILDLQGRVLLQRKNDFSSGYHEWVVERQSLTSKGILYYQLATDNEIITKKMMVF